MEIKWKAEKRVGFTLYFDSLL